MSNPQDPYGQQQPEYGQQQYQQQQQGYGYPQQQYQGYVAPKKPMDLAKIVTIGAWVVLALHGLYYLYVLTQDQYGADFADRFFDGMPTLAQGIFWAGLLLAVGVWLRRQQEST